jgi:hypothetical protein
MAFRGQNRGGKGVRRRYSYGVPEIAEATKQTPRAVRDHRRAGQFELGDLVSVARYVMRRVI